MAERIPALINPAMLVWAREEAGYTVEIAAVRSGYPLKKLAAWERGEAQPTLRQAENLAKIYDRAFSLFSLPDPPKLPPLAAEYRRLPGVTPGAESPELRVAVRRLVQRRRLALHLYAELGDDPPDFLLRALLNENTETVGQRLRESLDVPHSEQIGWISEYAAYRSWRRAVEKMGVLVCQFSGKDLKDLRGTSIVHFPLPVVGLNSKELPLSKPFTLLHEVIHLALAANEEEKPASGESRNEPQWQDVERFCEAAAGAALMPTDLFLAEHDVVSQKRDNSWEVAAMRRIARRYRVTPTAIATRLLRLGIMTPQSYAAQWGRTGTTYLSPNRSKEKAPREWP
jgi:Zn-dependent peptidase ImmA (M78 family)